MCYDVPVNKRCGKTKKYEQRIMDIVPLIMILYVNFTSGNMMSVMYNTLIGKLIMTICLLLYTVAFIIGEKITNISV